MNYLGLTGKYPSNRFVSKVEKEKRLEQRVKLEVEPAHQLSTIEINSNFIELVDKFFLWKGFMTLHAMAVIGLFSGGFFLVIWTLYSMPEPVDHQGIFIVFIFILCSIMVAGSIFMLRKESFTYTHYPIRLNRKTRMVHVFRINGTVLSVPWDEVFFCIAPCGKGDWEIQGHVLDKDKKTVLETFAFSEGAGSKLESEKLKNYWEFVRRYMEEGPESVIDGITGYLPISDRRETFIFGFHRMRFIVGAAPLILQIPILILNTLIYPARWFAMRTSKIPVWPKEIEEQCTVDPNDPYIRDARHNPQ
jgi:hypothetical protein